MGAPDPHLPQPNVHSPPPHPQACIRTRGIPSALFHSSGSPVLPSTSALQGPGHTPAGLRYSATTRPKPPLCNVNSQGILLLDAKHKQNLQSACAHMTHAHRHNTPAHPPANTQSQHVHPRRTTQTHTDAQHMSITITHHTHKISRWHIHSNKHTTLGRTHSPQPHNHTRPAELYITHTTNTHSQSIHPSIQYKALVRTGKLHPVKASFECL